VADNEQHRAALQELNRNYIRSVNEADVAWFDATLAADFFNTNPDGTFIDRKDLERLIGQGQNLHNSPVRRRRLSRSKNNGCELVVGEHAVATDFPIIRGNSLCRGKIDERHGPRTTEGMSSASSTFYAGNCVPLRNQADQIADVAFLNFMDNFCSARGKHIPAEQA
jgi:hypothetical protein